MKKVSLSLFILGLTATINHKPLFAQPIKPATDGTATVVTQQGDRFNIIPNFAYIPAIRRFEKLHKIVTGVHNLSSSRKLNLY